MAVAGADLKGRLQTLYGNCGVKERNHTVEFGGGGARLVCEIYNLDLFHRRHSDSFR